MSTTHCNMEAHVYHRPSHRRTMSESTSYMARHRKQVSGASQTPHRYNSVDTPAPLHALGLRAESDELSDMVRSDRVEHERAWAEAGRLLKYKHRAEARRARAGYAEPNSPSDYASTTSGSQCSSVYSTPLSSPINPSFPSLYSPQTEARLAEEMTILAEAKKNREMPRIYPLIHSPFGEDDDAPELKTARGSRFKPANIIRALSKSLSPQEADFLDPIPSPSKRLVPLSRYNPFIRPRSESLSSIVEENTEMLTSPTLQQSRRSMTLSNA